MTVMPIFWLTSHYQQYEEKKDRATRSIRISPKDQNRFSYSSQTAMPKEVESGTANSSAQVDSSYRHPWFPAELVMDIVKYLPLYDLVFSARLTNKVWGTFAIERAKALIGDWVSRLKHPVPQHTEILYQGTQLRLYQYPDLATRSGYRVRCSEDGTLVDFSVQRFFCIFEKDPKEDPKCTLPIIKKVEIYLTSEFDGSIRQDLGEVGEVFGGPTRQELGESGEPRLCLCFEHPDLYPIPENVWEWRNIQIRQPMKIQRIWMEDGQERRVNLTSIMGKMFNFKLNVEGNFERKLLGWTSHDRPGMCSRFCGYKASLEIAAVTPSSGR